MSKVALQANVCYNRGRNIVVPKGTVNTLWLVTHLLRRRITMDSLSPRDFSQQELPFSLSLFEHVTSDCQCQGKVCTKCDTLKCRGAFTKDNSKKDKLVFQCKVCKAEYRRSYVPSEQAKANQKAAMKDWNDAHKEERKAYNKTYQQTHREQIQSSTKTYRAAHQDEIKERVDAWRKVNPDYMQQYNQAYRQKNKERLNARSKRYYHENADKFIRLNREYELSHLEEVKARKKAHRQTNFEQYKARDAAYYQANKHERVRIWNKAIKARRRTRKTQAGGSYTAQEWQQLKAQYDYTCLCCGRKEPEIKLTADHVIPVVTLGTSNIENIQPLCGSCNSKKHNKVIDYRVRWQK